MKKRTNFFKSLRFRILIILIILGIVPSVIVTYTMLHNYQDRAVSMLTETVQDQSEILCNLIIKENYLNDTGSQTVNTKLEMFADLYNGRVLLADRDFKIVGDTFHTEEGKTLLSSLAVKCFKGEKASNFDLKSKVLEVAVPVQSPDVQQIQGVMLMTISTIEIGDMMAELEQKGMMLIGIIVVLSVFLSWLLSTILVKPLARVTKAIEDLTDGMQDDAISVPDYTETELITDAFNKMVNRMKILDESRQEFVSNVSHELKTPLTSMKVLADSLVGQQGVPEELYQEFMGDITAEIDRENKIITDLLSLVKMDKKAADLNITHMDINQLLEDILKRLRPIADKRNIDLILDCFRPVEADVDEVKFTLAISNLVENGIKYNVDDGWVRVSLDADHKYFYVTVADSGMGIPEDSIERIFERFYRVDKSHSKEIGGTGLGLAITRSAIAMHHGAIKVFSKEGEGTTFSVRIPLSYIAS
ncbi:two-component sensor histidine kinase [Blautia wexlerae]|uniref:histidine kinase n=1 Tax=Blautia wexlerae TaxID=418240 RepID=A0ABX2GL65_9FIRM|nr:HAMP domain-containing sensor histidine kinase [Blautia wexlerae]NSF73097.1 two-component sensor histidine kinase [Blautia wexlerae]